MSSKKTDKKSSAISKEISDYNKEIKTKPKGLFDHIKHIRTKKDPNYYTNLTDEEKKSFNLYMILKGLSMDRNLIELCAELNVFIDKIPIPQFYVLLCKLVPTSNAYFPWIKKSNSIALFNKKLINIISSHFKVTDYESVDYLRLYYYLPNGLETLIDLLERYGMEDKEIEKLIETYE